MWLLPAYVVVALLATPTTSSALRCWSRSTRSWPATSGPTTSCTATTGPGRAWYRSVWRNHRLHHYKNEHYWFTVTSAGTADRLFGTYPDPATVEKSPTARSLHSG